MERKKGEEEEKKREGRKRTVGVTEGRLSMEFNSSFAKRKEMGLFS